MADITQHNIKIQELAGPRARRFMALAMNRIERETILNLSGRVLNVRSGRLRGSVSTAVEIKGKSVVGKISAGGSGMLALIAKVWEFTGHKAFTVVPKNAKALAIPMGSLMKGQRVTKKFTKQTGLVKGEGRGLIGFRMKAHIPAASPRPFIAPAIEATRPYLLALHEKMFKSVMDEVKVEIPIGKK